MPAAPRTASEWTLWAVAASCALHPMEEYAATLLYLPFSSWAYLGAWRDGVPRRALAVAFMAGTFLMLAVVLAARWASGLGRVG